MEMHQVRYFLAAAECLNFTRAAERCNVAQPSLTRAIKLLEHELGGPLFHRERANTRLSDLGTVVLPYLSQIFEQSMSARRAAEALKSLAKTKVRLGVMCTIAPDQLIALFSAVVRRHADIDLELIDGAGGALHDKLLAGQLDAAIYCRGAQPLDDRVHAMPLFRERMMIVVAPDHPLARQDAIAVRDLDGGLYLQRLNCEFKGELSPHMLRQGVKAQTVYRSERDDWILGMVAVGLGYAFMPEHCVTHPGVIARPLVDPEFWRTVNLTTVRGRRHTTAIAALTREAMSSRWFGKPALAVQAEPPVA